MALAEGKTEDANEYFEKYKSIHSSNSASEADIKAGLAWIYSEAGIFDKAESYWREALSLEPNSWRMYQLAWLLIEKDRNINEGMELINKALESSPESKYYLHCKGWGLYKQSKYKEALEVLEKSWELKPLYIHDIYLHLVAAKKAVAGLKNY